MFSYELEENKDGKSGEWKLLRSQEFKTGIFDRLGDFSFRIRPQGQSTSILKKHDDAYEIAYHARTVNGK